MELGVFLIVISVVILLNQRAVTQEPKLQPSSQPSSSSRSISNLKRSISLTCSSTKSGMQGCTGRRQRNMTKWTQKVLRCMFFRKLPSSGFLTTLIRQFEGTIVGLFRRLSRRAYTRCSLIEMSRGRRSMACQFTSLVEADYELVTRNG